jgi:hypothetical protein
MKLPFRILALSCVACWMLVRSASAAVMVEPDAFVNGTDISHAYPGVTLTDVNGGGAVSPVISRTSPYASTGSRVFGRFSGEDLWGNGSWDFLRIDLVPPAGSASLDFISDDGDANPVLAAYDAAGNLLTFATVPGSFSPGAVVPLTVSAPNIATVLALGDPPADSFDTIAEITAVTQGGADNWAVDNFNYSAIPEPASITLIVAAVALSVGRRRTR